MSLFDLLEAIGAVSEGADLARGKRGCWTAVLIFALLFAGVMAYVYYFRG